MPTVVQWNEIPHSLKWNPRSCAETLPYVILPSQTPHADQFIGLSGFQESDLLIKVTR
jgi:hypothetical protein